MQVLLVEDDEATRKVLADALEDHGFTVATSDCGEDGWLRGDEGSYDAIILDLNLPDTDGLDVLTRWRERGVGTPVLALSGRGGWSDRVKGINLGADDYLVKPFRMEELVARLNAVIRRARASAEAPIEAGGVRLDPACGAAQVDGAVVELSNLELRTLAHLMRSKGRTVPGQELMDAIYGVNARQGHNALEVLVRRLRRKLGAEFVRTIRGVGYRIDDA